jgi:hypothetical protein
MWYLSDLHGNSFRFVSMQFDKERFLNAFEMIEGGKAFCRWTYSRMYGNFHCARSFGRKNQRILGST